MEGMALSTVFITQDAVGRNFLPAKQYGAIKILFPSNAQVIITATPAIRKLRRELRNFTDDDYMLLSGDPLIMGVALTMACSVNMGRAKVLKWDKHQKTYYDVQVDLNEKGELDE